MSGPVTGNDVPAGDDIGPHPDTLVFERHASRLTEVGGITVRRALPKRPRRTIGAWCFVDHFGPATGPVTDLMQVGPHPHIGLSTVTWLLEGEVLHRDSLGSVQPIRPGQLNLMTAGHGVAHAEETPPGTPTTQHGVQLWVAQPDATRNGPPAFEHHAELPMVDLGGWQATVLVGGFDGVRSRARADTPLVGVALDATDGREATVPLDPAFEHGLVVFGGQVALGDERVEPGELIYLGPGRDGISIRTDRGARALLIGGEPFPHPVVMWWNFVARDRDEIEQARDDWQEGSPRFPTFESSLARIDAPPVPWRQ